MPRKLVKGYSAGSCRPSDRRGSVKPTCALASGKLGRARKRVANCEFRGPSVALDCLRSRDCAAGNGTTSTWGRCRQRVNIPGRCNSGDSLLGLITICCESVSGGCAAAQVPGAMAGKYNRPERIPKPGERRGVLLAALPAKHERRNNNSRAMRLPTMGPLRMCCEARGWLGQPSIKRRELGELGVTAWRDTHFQTQDAIR